MSRTPKHLAQFNQETPAPKAPSIDAAHFVHGQLVRDPYNTLGILDAETTTEWVAAEMERTDHFFSKVATPVDKKDLVARPERTEGLIPIPAGDHYFTAVFDQDKAQPVYYRIPKNAPDATPEKIIDPVTDLDPTGNTSIEAFVPSHDGRFVAMVLATAGEENNTIVLYDVEKGNMRRTKIRDVNFYHGDFIWDDDSKGFRYNKDHTRVAHFTVGQRRSKIIFDASSIHNQISRFYNTRDEHNHPSPHDFITLQEEWAGADNGVYYRKRDDSKDAYSQLFNDGEHYLVPVAQIEGKLYARTNLGAEMGRLVAVDIDHPEPQHWQTIIPERAEDKIVDVTLHKGKLLVTRIQDAACRIGVYTLEGEHLHDAPLPEQVMSWLQIDRGNDEVQLAYKGFGYTFDSCLYDPDSNTLTTNFKRPDWARPADDYIIERVHATSKDGTQVPMTIVRHKDTKLDGSAATMMTGYGGFNNPRMPQSDDFQRAWLDNGGIFVQTNLRGGGEFGRKWYDDGRLLNKQNVFDDFAACGQYLIDQGYTTPKRLVTEGASNGGLLTLATMQQHPDLFGAVISQVPVTDMLCGKWKADYGDPDKSRADFDNVMRYSPLHNVKQGESYPPLMVMTTSHDSTVDPWHSYKFVATMQERAPDSLCLLHVTDIAGHHTNNQHKALANDNRIFNFCEAAIGPINQKRYQAWKQQQDVTSPTSWTERIAAESATKRSASR